MSSQCEDCAKHGVIVDAVKGERFCKACRNYILDALRRTRDWKGCTAPSIYQRSQRYQRRHSNASPLWWDNVVRAYEAVYDTDESMTEFS